MWNHISSRGELSMSEIMLFFACVFFAVAISAAFEYYRHVVKIKSEYEKAKEAFKDIILSFSREIKRALETLESISYKVDAAASRSAEALRSAENLEKRVNILETKISNIPELEKVQERIDDFDKKIRDIIASHEALITKISTLEDKTQKMLATSETSIETVIPIKREKALASLTETEIEVLEILAAEGPKTAPEIKEKIKLSREHTARLLKKLFEDGYLERDSSKIPFKYSIKKEMEEILNKTRVSAT